MTSWRSADECGAAKNLEAPALTSWRSSCGTWKFLDGGLYRKVNANGKTGVWVHVSENPTWLEQKLLNILSEILDEKRT